MAIDNFIPEIWSARLNQSLKKDLVFAQEGVVNRDYEGDIMEAGDTVRINTIGSVTVSNYTKNSNMLPPQELTDSQATLVIDQQKSFNFQVDDIDRAQQKPKVMDAAMQEAAYALSNVMDAYVAGLHTQITDPAHLLGTDGAPKAPDPTTAYEFLVDLGVLLTEANVPMAGRWIILPPWYIGLMAKDTRFVEGATPMAGSNIANGISGKIAGFTVLMSNNVANTANDKYKIMAGVPGGISVAQQVRAVEAYRPELRFADAVKGLHLYGAKVVRPEMLVLMTADRP